MPCKIQIYSPRSSPALDYTLGFVFDNFFECGFELISNREQLSGDAIVFNYSNEALENAISISPSGYLFENNLKVFPEIELFDWHGIPTFFKTKGDIPFDLFSAIFFLLSRVEEYANTDRDKHGRFSSGNSLFDIEFIQRPIIDEWLTTVKHHFLSNSKISFPKRKFKWINTYDIDVAYAYRQRPVFRILAASARNLVRLDFKSFAERLAVFFGGKPDPFDTYNFQKEVSTKYADETIYFFLLGNKGKYDRNLSHETDGMKSLVSFVKDYAAIGIHPSYASGDDLRLMAIEINRLENISKSQITKSRQHFLRFKLPETYRELIINGIQEDYSMGYADLPGFRSGTSTPHYFYDLEKNEATKLRLYPLIIMEASLRDYLKYDKAKAWELIWLLMTRVKEVNGVFTTLWHNDSLAELPENYWRDLYLEMAAEIKST